MKRMKELFFFTLIMAFLMCGMAMAGGWGKAGNKDLSAEEEAGLFQMREEEKLARDVYLTMFEKWGHWVFTNIASSEQKHMDAVKALLDKYNLEDPAAGEEVGDFKDAKIQSLYGDLVEAGSVSLVEALRVGATIEDLDIFDLKEFLSQTDNQDITNVYENLVKGSRNHLRTFVYQLEIFGESYIAQYLDQEEIDAIVNSPKETGKLP